MFYRQSNVIKNTSRKTFFWHIQKNVYICPYS